MKYRAISLFSRIRERISKQVMLEVGLVLAMILPLVAMLAHEPTILRETVHAPNMMEAAAQLLSGYVFTLTCATITNWFPLYYGPLLIYFLTPFFAIWWNIMTLYVVGAALGVLAGLLIYRLGRDFFGIATARYALWLYATAVYVPNLVRMLSIEEYLPFFCVLAIYAVFQMRFKHRLWYFPVLSVALALPLQTHVSTDPLILLLLFVPWRKLWRDKRPFLAGLVVLILLFLPWSTYIWGERARVPGMIAEMLEGISQGGQESMLGSKDDYHAFGDAFEPLSPFLMESKYGYQMLPFFLRAAGVNLYKALYFLGFPLMGVILATLPIRQMLMGKRPEIDSRFLILAIVAVGALAWLLLFPYHQPEHLTLVFISATILLGAGFSSVCSLPALRRYKVVFWSVLFIAGIASSSAFLTVLRWNAASGRAATLSGLPLSMEISLSEWMSEHYPALRDGHRILIPDAVFSHEFILHNQLIRKPSLPEEVDWSRFQRSPGECGPSATYIPFIRRFFPSHAREDDSLQQEGVLPGSSRVPDYVLVFPEELLLPLNATKYPCYPVMDLAVIEVDASVFGTAHVVEAELLPEGRSFRETSERYELSLPRSEVRYATFPPLREAKEAYAYLYTFNATERQSKVILFLSTNQHHPMRFYLDGMPINATQPYGRSAGFLLNVSGGEHTLATIFLRFPPEGQPTQYNGPFGGIDIHLFDFGPPESAGPGCTIRVL